jgi:hypothetical protein
MKVSLKRVIQNSGTSTIQIRKARLFESIETTEESDLYRLLDAVI